MTGEGGEGLLARLDAAAQLYEQDQRKGSAEALRAVLASLLPERATVRQIWPLTKLLFDLTGDTLGNLKPMPQATGEAMALAVVGALVADGLTMKEARLEVSKAMGGRKSADQLKTLQENLRDGRQRREMGEMVSGFEGAFQRQREGQQRDTTSEVWRQSLLALVASNPEVKRP